MSRFSGRADLYDWLQHQDSDYIEKCDFYIHTPNGFRHKLDIHTERDAARYFPYIVSMASADEDSSYVYLTSESFIDTEERRSILLKCEEVIKCWKRYKKNNEKFDANKVYRDLRSINSYFDSTLQEVIEEVAKNGDKPDCSKIHKDISEYYRVQWFKSLTEEYSYSIKEAFNVVFGGDLFATDEDIKNRLALAEERGF